MLILKNWDHWDLKNGCLIGIISLGDHSEWLCWEDTRASLRTQTQEAELVLTRNWEASLKPKSLCMFIDLCINFLSFVIVWSLVPASLCIDSLFICLLCTMHCSQQCTKHKSALTWSIEFNGGDNEPITMSSGDSSVKKHKAGQWA